MGRLFSAFSFGAFSFGAGGLGAGRDDGAAAHQPSGG
jgi:hypothetical protein